jgi:SIT family siderophore-iron:H+ symporter-like MFS transporter
MSRDNDVDVDKNAQFNTTVTGVGSRTKQESVSTADHGSQSPGALPGVKSPGVIRIEALNAHTSFINRCCIFFGIFLVAYAYGLDGTLRYTYQPYATAGFQEHSTLATISMQFMI